MKSSLSFGLALSILAPSFAQAGSFDCDGTRLTIASVSSASMVVGYNSYKKNIAIRTRSVLADPKLWPAFSHAADVEQGDNVKITYQLSAERSRQNRIESLHYRIARSAAEVSAWERASERYSRGLVTDHYNAFAADTNSRLERVKLGNLRRELRDVLRNRTQVKIETITKSFTNTEERVIAQKLAELETQGHKVTSMIRLDRKLASSILEHSKGGWMLLGAGILLGAVTAESVLSGKIACSASAELTKMLADKTRTN